MRERAKQAQSLSFEELVERKEAAAAEKIKRLRELSDAEREQLNEAAADRCDEIAKQFGKSRPYLPAAKKGAPEAK